MIIQHNITALNAYNRLSGNNSTVSKNLEKLSSGYRINRAGDDAAGLAISEKMRAQITGLERAKLNAQDGISLVQTAEGALTEVHSMLNRMVELDTQSANGTYQAEDRDKIQAEVNALLEEVDRISQSTNFNGINLLDGSLSSNSTQNLSTGNKVATVTGTIASLKTGIQDQAAQAGKYAANLAGSVTGTATAVTDAVKFSVTYIDTNGKEVTKELTTATVPATATDANVASAISTAIGNDKDLSTLFTASSTTSNVDLTAKNGGTNGAQLKSISVVGLVKTDGTAGTAGAINVQKAEATTTRVATDATQKDIVDFNNTVPTAGSTITIGDKTYEFVAAGGDMQSVAKGNVAVSLDAGGTVSGTLDNLISALQANGVKSASKTADAAGNANAAIKIGNLDEIKTASKTANITANSNGLKLSEVSESEQKSSFQVGAGSGNSATFSLKYLDDAGKEQTINVSYTSNATAATNATNIKNALEANDEFKKNFTVGITGAQLDLTSKSKGDAAAQVQSIATNDVDSKSVNSFQVTQAARGAGQTLSIDAAQMSKGDTLTIGGKTFQFVTADNMKADGNNIAVLLDPKSNTSTAANLNLAFEKAGVDIQYNNATNSFFLGNDAKVSGNGGLVLQVGDTNADFNKVTVSVEDMSVKGLNLEGLTVTDQGLAGESIDRVKKAIETVSKSRGNLGALQNRLEHTINNLTVTAENMTAAESRIRDTDMAKEMMSFTKNNVLVQAAQAMLAQANQQPQQVLQLLR